MHKTYTRGEANDHMVNNRQNPETGKSPLIDAFINKLWSREKMEDQPSTNNASGLRPVTPTVICCSRVPQHGCI